MLLDISNALRNPGQTYPVAAQVELEPVEVLGDTIRFEDISLKGTMVGAGETVTIEGELSTKVHAHAPLMPGRGDLGYDGSGVRDFFAPTSGGRPGSIPH